MCSTYAIEHLLTINRSKSYSLCFNPKHIKLYAPCLYLIKLEIPKVDHCKYLDVMISIKNCDFDMERQMSKFYANINILSKKISKCSPDVKCTLFKSFCFNRSRPTCMYCSKMWYNNLLYCDCYEKIENNL